MDMLRKQPWVGRLKHTREAEATAAGAEKWGQVRAQDKSSLLE